MELRYGLEGLITGDKEMLLKGIDQILEEHHTTKAGGEHATALVCVLATVLVKLARGRGMMIGPDDIKDVYRQYMPVSII